MGQRKGEKEGQNGTHAEVPVSHVNEIRGIFLPRVQFLAGKRDAAFEKSLDNRRDNNQSTGCVKEYNYVNIKYALQKLIILAT